MLPVVTMGIKDIYDVQRMETGFEPANLRSQPEVSTGRHSPNFSYTVLLDGIN